MLAASSCWSLATGVAEPSGQAPIVPSADEATWRSGLSVDALRELVHHGKPSDELSEVGLTIHSFDGSEHYQQPWKPCTADGWCKPFRTWWSASVVNAKNGHAVSDSGVLLAPKHTRVLCSAANATALGVDCTGAHRTLSQTLAASLDESALANEVRFDSQHYVRQLPDSVAGFFYFDDAETPELVEAARSQAARAYLAFLGEYQLREADLPLLRLSRAPPSLSRGAGLSTVADESTLARASLRRRAKPDPNPKPHPHPYARPHLHPHHHPHPNPSPNQASVRAVPRAPPRAATAREPAGRLRRRQRRRGRVRGRSLRAEGRDAGREQGREQGREAGRAARSRPAAPQRVRPGRGLPAVQLDAGRPQAALQPRQAEQQPVGGGPGRARLRRHGGRGRGLEAVHGELVCRGVGRCREV